jgi:hypothetical protein
MEMGALEHMHKDALYGLDTLTGLSTQDNRDVIFYFQKSSLSGIASIYFLS